jgi:PAS domain S-box-containing protein
MLVVIFPLLFSGAVRAEANDKRTLVVGSEEEYPPFALGKTEATADGFTVDLWKAVAAEKKLAYTLRVLPFRQLLEEFKAGKIDVMLNLAQSDERHAFSDFSVPHMVVYGAVFVRKGEEGVRSETDLAGKSVIVLNADLAHDYAISKGWGKQLVPVQTAADGLKLLASGKHDAMLLSKLVGMQTLPALGVQNIRALPEAAGFSQKFSFAVRKGDTDLLAEINEGLALVKSGGQYDALREKWFGLFEVREVTFRDFLKYLGPVAAACALLGGIVLLRQRDRRKAGRRLRESEERLRLALSAANQGTYDLNVQTGECIASPEYALMLGYEPGNFHETHDAWIERLHPDDRQATLRRYTDYVEGRLPDYRVEFRQRTKAGKWKWILSLGSVVARTADGRPLRMLGTHTDVSARKEAEEALRESELRFRTLTSHAPVGILMTDIEGGCLFVNECWCAMAGMKPEAATGSGWLDAVHGEDRERVRLAWRIAAAGGKAFALDFRMQTPEGHITSVQGTGTGLSDGKGTLKGYVGTITDVTARIQAEADLMKSEEHLRTVMNLAPECVKLISPDGRVLEMNPAGLAMIGAASLEEVRGHPLAEFIAQEDRSAYLAMHRRVLGGEHGHCEFTITGLKGAQRIMETHAVPYRNAQRDIIGVLGIARDITQRKEAGAELDRTFSTLQLFINSVPAYISFVDADERYQFVNRNYEIYFGKPADRIVGQRIRDLESPEAYAEMAPYIRKALDGLRVRYESNPAGPDGGSQCFDIQYVPRRDGDGVVSGFFVLVFDITEKKRAEIALIDSRSRLDSILNSMEDVVWSSTPDGRALNFVSASVHVLYGRPASEFMADPVQWLAMIHPEDREEATRAFHDVPTTGEFDAEYRIVRDDGAVRWVHDRRWIVKDDHGQPLRLDGIVTDITERRAAESALQERERAYATLLQNLAGMVYRCRNDADWTTTFVSDGCLAVTGYPSEDLIGNRKMSLGSLIHPDDAAPIWEKCQAGLAARRPCSNEYRIRTAGGAEKWVWDQARGIYSATGELLFIEGYITDITERKTAADALRDSEARYRTLFEANPHPMWVYDLETLRFLAVNTSAVSHYGYSREEFLAMTIKDIRPPEDIPALIANVETVVEGLDEAGVWRHLKRDGSIIEVEITSHVMEFDGRRAKVVLAHDVTEERRAKLEREQLDRKVQEIQKLESLGVLAGGVAHDFNNILTVILGNASLALNDASPGSPVRECVDQISEAALRAADLCRQMLAYSGRGRFVVRRLDLGELIAETTEMLQISVSKKAALRFRIGTDLPPVEVDSTQMRQVIMNLVINASEAIGDKGGLIDVATGLVHVDSAGTGAAGFTPDLPGGEYVSLEVSDSGCGMSEEIQARIFDPFFTTKFAGRGLGLAAVLGIVRGHKGAVKVASQPGRGTTFTLLFPAAEGQIEADTQSPSNLTDWRGHGTVLVVDDEPAIRATIAHMLPKMGLTAVPAADGMEGVETFRADPSRFALVLLDLTMPRMDGVETFAELRKLRPDIPVVLMSGFNKDEALVRFVGKGLASFIQKPFSLDSVRAVISSVLG